MRVKEKWISEKEKWEKILAGSFTLSPLYVQLSWPLWSPPEWQSVWTFFARPSEKVNEQRIDFLENSSSDKLFYYFTLTFIFLCFPPFVLPLKCWTLSLHARWVKLRLWAAAPSFAEISTVFLFLFYVFVLCFCFSGKEEENRSLS